MSASESAKSQAAPLSARCLASAAFGDHDEAALDMPAQHHLRRRSPEPLRDLDDRLVPQLQPAPRLRQDALGGVVGTQVALL